MRKSPASREQQRGSWEIRLAEGWWEWLRPPKKSTNAWRTWLAFMPQAYGPVTRPPAGPGQPASPGEVEDEAEHLTDLQECGLSDVAPPALDAARRNGADVLALSGRRAVQPVLGISFEFYLRCKPSKRGCQRHHLDDTRPGVEHPLSRHHDRRVMKAGFSPGRQPEVQVDDITRGQHQANRLPPP